MAEDAGFHPKKRGEVFGSYLLNGFPGGVVACAPWLAYGTYGVLYMIGEGQAAPGVQGYGGGPRYRVLMGVSSAKRLQSGRDEGR